MRTTVETVVFVIAVIVTIAFLIVDIMSVVQRNAFAVLMNATITYLLYRICLLLWREAQEAEETKKGEEE